MGFKDLCILEEYGSPGLNQGVEGVEEDELEGHAGGGLVIAEGEAGFHAEKCRG